MCPDLVYLELDLVNVDVNNSLVHLAVYSDNIKILTKDFRLKSLGTNVYNFNWSKDYPKMDQGTEYAGLASWNRECKIQILFHKLFVALHQFCFSSSLSWVNSLMSRDFF